MLNQKAISFQCTLPARRRTFVVLWKFQLGIPTAELKERKAGIEINHTEYLSKLCDNTITHLLGGGTGGF